MEVSQGSTTCKSQDGEDPKHVEVEEMLRKHRTSDQARTSDDSQATDDRRPPDVRQLGTRTESTDDRDHRTSDRCTPEPNLRTIDDFRTYGPS